MKTLIFNNGKSAIGTGIAKEFRKNEELDISKEVNIGEDIFNYLEIDYVG